MGSDDCGVQETPLHLSYIKVHLPMCTQLMRLVNRISSIVPDIEAARPGASGIQALCLLQNAIEKARELVHNCCQSSKLYLALTGDTIVLRFERTRNLLEQSLSQLQSMVPVVLESEISEILYDLRDAIFFMDPHEEEAGKAIRALLQQDASVMNSIGKSEVEVLQFAASRLDLSSQKDLLIEKRSLRKLLNEVKEGNSTKRKTLKYLSHLLKNYDKLIVVRGQNRDFNPSTQQRDELSLLPKSYNKSFTPTKSTDLESHPTSKTSLFGSSHETSSNSICSNASSMRDLYLRIDMSNISLGSLDSSSSLDAKVEDSFSSSNTREPSDVDSHRFQFYDSIHDIKRRFLSNVNGLPWESQCRAVEDVRYYLTYYNPSCAFASSENFLEPLVVILKNALENRDAEAQKSGSQLFLIFLRASRREAAEISEDVYTLLSSSLTTEAASETLAIMEVLSAPENALPKFATSGALTSIIKTLNTNNKEFQEAAIKILYNLSSSIGAYSSCKLASEWVPKLVPFLRDTSVSGTCLGILENLSIIEEARVCIAETEGCIASIVELLETGSSKEQEHAAGVLLSLCAHHDRYCDLVLHEGVVPALCHVSINGNVKGKARASELLRLLRDVKYEEEEEEIPRSNGEKTSEKHLENFEKLSISRSNGDDASEKKLEDFEENKSSRMLSVSFGRKMKMFLRKK